MPCEEQRGKYTTILREMSTKHSKSPECAYQIIEKYVPQAKKIRIICKE